MKTNIAVFKLAPWNFKTEDQRELSGFSALWSFDNFDNINRTTVKEGNLELLQSVKLPAIFEVELQPVQKYNKGKASLKYEISSFKLLKEVQIFNQA